jgi:phage terminase large subunit
VRRRVDIAALEHATATKGQPSLDPALRKYAKDPVKFAREVLGIKPWSKQAALLTAIAAHGRVACRSGHRIGKSTTAAIIALWWVATRGRGRVVLTAPTARQVREVLWREVRRLHREAKKPIGGEMNDTPAGGLRFDDGREIIGVATDEGERFAGLAGPEMLFIVDEASGVSERIFETLLGGNMAGGGCVVLLGNPTRLAGTFFDAFGTKSALWNTHHISSLESPNISGEVQVPGLATAQWADDMAADYGEESSVYAVRVRGEFPSQAADCVIALALVEAAKERWSELMVGGGKSFTPALGLLEVGADIARFGDDSTCLVIRRGPVALAPILIKGADTVAVAERILKAVEEHRGPNERAIVRVDTVGVGGGVADQLRRVPGLQVLDINASASAKAATYQRTRDELWFQAKAWLKAGGALPTDQKLEGELLSATYRYTPGGKIEVESKDLMRQRLRRSPDRADALCLAVYAPSERAAVIPTTVTRGPFSQSIQPSRRDGWGLWAA